LKGFRALSLVQREDGRKSNSRNTFVQKMAKGLLILEMKVFCAYMNVDLITCALPAVCSICLPPAHREE
jgi:hypothetical protein